MQKESVSEFLSTLTKDTSSLLDAHQIITQRLDEDITSISNGKDIEKTFLNQWLQFIGEQNETNQKYFQAITIFHPPIADNFDKFPESMQDALRSGLLNSAIARIKNQRVVGAIGYLVREIVQKDNENDGFKQWIEPLEQLIKWMASQEEGSSQSGVSFFIAFYKESNFTVTNTEMPLTKIAPQMLSALFEIFTNAPQNEQQSKSSLRQQILYLVFQVFKTFAYLDGSDDDQIKQCLDGSFQLWISLFVSILKGPVNGHLGVKKYVMKILIIIYRDLTNYSQKRLPKSSGQLLTIWEFVYRFMPLFLASQVWGLKRFQNQKIIVKNQECIYDDDNDTAMSLVQALAHCCIQFLSVISSSSLFNFTVRLSIHHIVNILFHFYIIQRSELSTWSYNNLYFISNPDYESMRGKVLNILNELIERNSDFAIQAILLIAEKFLINHPQSNTIETVKKIMDSMNINQVFESGKLQLNIQQADFQKFVAISGYDIKSSLNVQGETWRKSEVALSILGRFSEDIIVFQSKQQGVFDIESFVKGLVRQFEIQQQNIEIFTLKGQSLYCLTRFTQIISIKYRNLFCDLVASCSSCSQQIYPTAVRVATCKILTIFLRKIQKHGLKLSEEHLNKIRQSQVTEGIMSLQCSSQTNIYALQAIIQIVKTMGHQMLSAQILPFYVLDNIHRNISHPSTLKFCFILFQLLCKNQDSYRKVLLGVDETNSPVIPSFIRQCLLTYSNVVKSQQKKQLKPVDIELIVTVLKIANIAIENCPQNQQQIYERMSALVPLLNDIIGNNEDISVHVASTICLKSLIKKCPQYLKKKQYAKYFIESIHSLLKIPADKTFEAASIYVGNLIILTFDQLLEKPDQSILEEVVLKVFRSRTPSVIQSLILTYSRLINASMDPSKPFNVGDWETKSRNIVDFLSSFSIQNRMGLKILVDKWLLQQSLFRGKYTKISTFMALSKLFLLRDKRVDNLLVIGFNPSHTNINNDVNAPLKILATLIRCFHNQMGGDKDFRDENDEDQEKFQMKNQGDKALDVNLQKFKNEQEPKQGAGGLADRQNQQGSTCYMSAMLQFYDDGEQCDQTTQQDLGFLKDISTKFQLSDYLNNFFEYLNDNSNHQYHQYFKQCLKDLLKDDIKNLQKHIKLTM